jgi:hypothetical protein
LFLTGLGPGEALGLDFWISWQFGHRARLVTREREESVLPLNGQAKADYFIWILSVLFPQNADWNAIIPGALFKTPCD